MLRILAGALALVVIACLPAQARHHARVAHHSAAAPTPAPHDHGCGDDRYLWTCDVRSPEGKVQPRRVERVAKSHVGSHVERKAADVVRGGLVTVKTAIGQVITVSASIKDRMLAFIADLPAHGYTPRRVSCYASGGHVTHSRHYSGNACDFDGSISIAPFFRTAEAEKLIRAHGLHSGCDYVLHGVRDCGHVDDRVGFAGRKHRRRQVARR